MSDTIDVKSIQYQDMEKKYWLMTRPLRGGSSAMRENRTLLLPKEKFESDEAYNNRLKRTWLYDGYNQAVRAAVSKPFSSQVTVIGDLPDSLAMIPQNVDRQGTNLTDFARKFYDAMIDDGVAHILAMYPPVPDNATAADEINLDIRPYFRLVRAQDMIGWRTDTDLGGREYLSQIRIAETSVVPSGQWSDAKLDRVYVVRPGYMASYFKSGDRGYMLEWESENVSTGIPLVTAYSNRTGYLTGSPPLLGVAESNVAHWQSASDQANILRMSRFAILYAKGFSDEELSAGLDIGPKTLVASRNPESDLRYVEVTGAALDAGHVDIKDKEEQMIIGGLQPFVTRSGNVTATEQMISQDKSQNDILAWIQTCEMALELAFRYAAEWVGTELPEDFKVDIYSDFGVASASGEEIKSLILARQSRLISRETFLREVRRRGFLAENTDIDTEAEALDAEGPSLADIGMV